MEERAALIGQEVIGALGHIHEKQVDLVFIDPPYQMGYEEKVLSALGRMNYINEETLIILETSVKTKSDEFLPAGWRVVREKDYKTNKHWFLKREETVRSVKTGPNSY
jgi:16S rRNA (guanine966-N2)-methyltransferase